jgi:GNAT superfamily N-acetyltransferase
VSHASAPLRAVLRTLDAYHALGAQSSERRGALFLRNDACPRVYDANHVRAVATPDAHVARMLDVVDRFYADRDYRAVRSDARAPASLEAKLLLAGYERTGGEIVMTLDGDVRGRAADVRIAPLASEADWDAWRAVKAQDARAPWFAEIGDEWMRHVRSKPPHAAYVGAFDGGALLGFFSAFVHDGVGHLEDLLVAPSARNRGVATALVAHCAENARRRGAKLVFVPAAHDDTPKAMYAAMGFAPLGTVWSWHRS